MNLVTKLDDIPVTINDCYGDPLFDLQFPNTLYKMKELFGRTGQTVLITKGVADKKKIKNMHKYIGPNFAIVYSLTGLNEGRISFDKRERTINSLYEICKNLVILARPIISKKNDSFQNLKRIIDIASNTSKTLVYGGLKKISCDEYQSINSELEANILSYSNKKRVRIFPKSSCAVSALVKSKCYTHIDNCMPDEAGEEVLRKVGYTFRKKSGRLSLDEGTVGDSNFIRFLTLSRPSIGEMRNSNILSFSKNSKIFEATSSYFIWSRNISSCYGCNYCLINDLYHLKFRVTNLEIGCNPRDLLKLEDGAN